MVCFAVVRVISAIFIVAESKHADDIPRANTPRSGPFWPFLKCGYGSDPEDMPSPILANCTDPIAAGIPDFRGLWKDDHHMERIEQCSDRVVVTGGGVVHDCLHADGSLENGVHDTPAPLEPFCLPGNIMHVAFKFEDDGCLRMYPFNLGINATTRCLNADGTMYFHWGSRESTMTRVKEQISSIRMEQERLTISV